MADLEKPWWLLPARRVHAGWWIAIAAGLVSLEYFTGVYTQFPVAYVIPVLLAAWYSGRWPSVMLAVTVAFAHLAFIILAGNPVESMAALVAATTARGIIIALMGLWFARLSEHERELRREVHTLQGLLQICSFCKRIKNESGGWEPVEPYISRRSATQFSHALCPSCQETHYSAFVTPRS